MANQKNDDWKKINSKDPNQIEDVELPKKEPIEKNKAE